MPHALNTLFFSLALFVAILLALEGGRRIGGVLRARHPGVEAKGSGAAEGAVFSLLGLLIAFTFSGAAARFEERLHLVTEEANDIGTAYLRLDLLPADQHQSGQATHAVEKAAGEAVERGELAPTRLGGADTRQCHGDWHEQPCGEQDGAGYRIDAERRDRHQSGPGHGEHGGRQPPRQETFQRLDPIDDEGGAFADRALILRALGE